MVGLRLIGLVMLSAIYLSIIVRGDMLKRGPWVVSVETEHQVDAGIHDYSVVFIRQDPCKPIATTQSQSIQLKNILVQNSYARLHLRCVDTSKRTWDPAWDALKREAKAFVKESRIKREPVTLATVVTIVGAVAGPILYVAHPRSPLYTIPALEQQMSHANQNISNIQARLQIIQNNSMIANELIENTVRKVAELDKLVERSYTNIADVSWLGNEVHYELMTSSRAINLITHLAKQRKVPTGPLGYLVNSTEVARLDTDSTRLMDIDVGDFSFKLHFRVKKRDECCSIIRLDPFHMVKSVLEPTKMLVYKGPEYLIHNFTSNCSQAISHPKQRFVVASCLEQNFRSKDLELWKEIAITEVNEAALLEPQVKKTEDSSIIYCLYNNLTTPFYTVACPTFPFILPITNSFQVKNHNHEVLNTQVDTISRQSSVNYLYVNETVSKDIFLNEQNILIQKFRENSKLIDKLSRRQEETSIPVNYVITGALAAGAVTVIMMLATCFCSRTGSSTATAPVYNVINNGPAPPMDNSDGYAPLRASRDDLRIEMKDYPNLEEDQHRVPTPPPQPPPLSINTYATVRRSMRGGRPQCQTCPPGKRVHWSATE